MAAGSRTATGEKHGRAEQPPSPSWPAARVGVRIRSGLGLGSPSWPVALRPKANTAPSLVSTRVCAAPQATCKQPSGARPEESKAVEPVTMEAAS
eukprot:scaffold6783_cov61-Phaeocystis_antarctica.AAC.5